MNISRDVVKDLIPVYLAGDASSDTQALVESYLKTDPELAGDVTAARATSLGVSRAVGIIAAASGSIWTAASSGSAPRTSWGYCRMMNVNP